MPVVDVRYVEKLMIMVLSVALVVFAPSSVKAGEQSVGDMSKPARQALDEAKKALAAVKIGNYPDAEDASRAMKAGITAEKVRDWVQRISFSCLEQTTVCFDTLKKHTEDDDFFRSLVKLLGEMADGEALPLLWQLDKRGYYVASSARERIFERRLEAHNRKHNCTPPTEAEQHTVAQKLEHYVSFEMKDDIFIARLLNPDQRNDLAYFLASVADADPPVGYSPEHRGGSFTQIAKQDPGQEKRMKALSIAQRAGDLDQMRHAAKGYLAYLGYPGPINAAGENAYSWGGPIYAHMLATLAEVDESQGKYREAADHYRRGRPGGGACGTSVRSRLNDQIKGFIRTTEQSGQCRAALPYRLLGIDDNRNDRAKYGREFLTRSGFDVARLYRGALVTLYYDAPIEVLDRAIRSKHSPLLEDQRKKALKQLADNGNANWESRVLALEGLANLGRANIGTLLRVAQEGYPPAQKRALRAIGRLAMRPQGNPCLRRCVNGIQSLGVGGVSSRWERPVRSSGYDCKGYFDRAMRDQLARQLASLLRSADMTTVESAITALGMIASPVVISKLKPFLKSRYAKPGMCIQRTVKGKEKCVPIYTLRDTSKEALKRIRELEIISRKESRKHCRNHSGF